ncbi:MAG: hypothetical protein HY304_00465 [candidate division Zixibacteria bacterium]|nr:hypothetical protein [candidate division Zixibacteria bacterium]
MADEIRYTEEEWHRKCAKDLFNFVWTLLEKKDRTQDDDDTMIHAAHASRYHWMQIGQPVQFARGEWQVSRVYAVLKRGEASHYHAQRCLDICEQHGLGDFDRGAAYEALARAAAVSGNMLDCRRFASLARAAGERITDPEDRQILFDDLKTLPGEMTSGAQGS